MYAGVDLQTPLDWAYSLQSSRLSHKKFEFHEFKKAFKKSSVVLKFKEEPDFVKKKTVRV
jgi:hypothetical protein